MKWVGILATAAVGACVASAANAAITVNIFQSGGNVVADTSGSLDLTGLKLSSVGPYVHDTEVWGSLGYIGTGAGGDPNLSDPSTYSYDDGYKGLTGPTEFGTGAGILAQSGTGDRFALNASQYGAPYVFVPQGYVSGATLASDAIFGGQTLASLGLTQGSYVYSSAYDSVTINIGSAVPEPGAWAMMLMGLAAVGGWLRAARRRRAVQAAAPVA